MHTCTSYDVSKNQPDYEFFSSIPPLIAQWRWLALRSIFRTQLFASMHALRV